MNPLITWMIYAAAQGSGWPGNLHQSEFLRVRSPSASTIEGINRAVVEFELPFQRFDRVELVLEGRDSTQHVVELFGYDADGELTVGDLTVGVPLLGTFTQTRYEDTVIDVTDFVRAGGPYVGFRLQLADEAGLPIGLNVRSEWETNVRLLVYPTCYVDCVDDGAIDIFDFLCFQDKFVVSSSYACDCDTSTGVGVCDIFDFLCFQNAFIGGCTP